MFTVLNLSAVLYSNLIGQRQVFVSNADQPKAPLDHGQNWSLGPNFDHFAQSEWSLSNKSAKYGQMNSENSKYNQIQIKDVAMYL